MSEATAEKAKSNSKTILMTVVATFVVAILGQHGVKLLFPEECPECPVCPVVAVAPPVTPPVAPPAVPAVIAPVPVPGEAPIATE